MSGEPEPGFILNDIKTEGEQGDQNLGNNGFILHSPTNSGLKNGPQARKKTKFDKLLKLYKELLEKKQNNGQKKQEAQFIKPEETTQAQQQVDPAEAEFLNLEKVLEGVRRQAAQEQTKGQARSQQLLNEVSQLEQNNKSKQNNFLNLTQQAKQLQAQVQKTNDILKSKQDEKASIHRKSLEENEKLGKLKSTLTELTVGSSFILNDLENQKLFLINQIKSARDEIAEIQKSIANKKESASEGEKAYSELEKKLGLAKKDLQQLKKKYHEDEKLIKDITAKAKKQKQADQKANKSIVELTKQLNASADAVKKLEKEEADAREKLQKVKEDEKDKQSNEQIAKAKSRNDKLKAELEKSKKAYLDQQEKAENLVTPKLFAQLKEDVAKGKALYDQYKNLPQELPKLQKQIQDLEQEKTALQWKDEPLVKYIEELDSTRKREQEDLSKLQAQVKESTKQQERVAKNLQQYLIAYPEFEAKRLKNKQKKAALAKKESKQQTAPKKVVEQANATKKKKKGKNDEKSPEPAEFVIQKVEKKQESPVKVEKKQSIVEPPKEDGDKKKKKKK